MTPRIVPLIWLGMIERVEITVPINGDVRLEDRVVGRAFPGHKTSFIQRPNVECDFVQIGEATLLHQHGDILTVQDYAVPLTFGAGVEMLEQAIQLLLCCQVHAYRAMLENPVTDRISYALRSGVRYQRRAAGSRAFAP